ncbi:MAG: beta-N-acetylhexosaminidase, partial [Lachnospiraceae bacterium]
MSNKVNGYEGLSPEEKRELRRQRRIRNLIGAYIGLILVLACFILGGMFGVRALTKFIEERKENNSGEEIMSESWEEDLQFIEEETEVEVQPDTSRLLDEIIEARISEMTLEEKVAGLFIVRPEDITGVNTAIQAGEGTKEALQNHPVGGIIYFNQNIKS